MALFPFLSLLRAFRCPLGFDQFHFLWCGFFRSIPALTSRGQPDQAAALKKGERQVAPRFVIFEAWAFLLLTSRDFPDPKLGSPQLVHQHGTGLVISVVPKAAPRPLLRFQHQASLHRIPMHVAQLLHSLLL